MIVPSGFRCSNGSCNQPFGTIPETARSDDAPGLERRCRKRQLACRPCNPASSMSMSLQPERNRRTDGQGRRPRGIAGPGRTASGQSVSSDCRGKDRRGYKPGREGPRYREADTPQTARRSIVSLWFRCDKLAVTEPVQTAGIGGVAPQHGHEPWSRFAYGRRARPRTRRVTGPHLIARPSRLGGHDLGAIGPSPTQDSIA